MKIINRARASGKTTMLINTAYTTGYPIIVSDVARARCVERMAVKLGLDRVRVFTVAEWLKERPRTVNYGINKVLIDEAEQVIESALIDFLHADIIACTMSVPMTELPKKEDKEEVKTDDN
jgi:rRNA-processing protein FCF1